MYKLLIVDDEPLVQVGIKSMLNWQELNIEVCATATNGQIAMDLIEKFNPDIVITDIKMPVMDGLELLRVADEKYGVNRPLFIMLTSYEDFRLAKEAIRYQAFDYLVKVELTPDTLRQTVVKAVASLDSNPKSSQPQVATQTGLHSYKEKFMISLLNNLFESEEQMLLQAKDLNIDLSGNGFLCCYGSFENKNSEINSPDKEMSLYVTSLQMVRELIEKYVPCFCLSLDISHFALILRFNQPDGFTKEDYKKVVDILEKIKNSVYNYYNVSLRCGIGFIVNNLIGICESYQYSRLSYRKTSDVTPVFYLEEESDMPHDAFHFSLFRKELTKAFEEYNSLAFQNTVSSLCELLSAHPHHFVQALDAASNILYLSISLLPDGTETLAKMFNDYPEGYMSLYRQTSVEQVVTWLTELSDSVSALFDERKKDYKNRIVSDVKAYISDHIKEKLSLNEVAARFGISPSYLSQLFGRYNDTGFSEYINILKVEAAKQMLREENSKVYEVADALSFGSEFYFSKVFKKVEGISPTEFINSLY